MQQLTKQRVLVIEDDKISQRITQLFLEKMGFEVNCVGTGRQALKLYQDYDLIISDLGLPDIDGITICKTIRNQSVKSQIPIIALTANDFCEQACLEAKFNDFIVKPVEYKVLQKSIKEQLAKKN